MTSTIMKFWFKNTEWGKWCLVDGFVKVRYSSFILIWRTFRPRVEVLRSSLPSPPEYPRGTRHQVLPLVRCWTNSIDYSSSAKMSQVISCSTMDLMSKTNYHECSFQVIIIGHQCQYVVCSTRCSLFGPQIKSFLQNHYYHGNAIPMQDAIHSPSPMCSSHMQLDEHDATADRTTRLR